MTETGLRADLELIQQWIPRGSRVLDLGCGDGTLLAHLQQHKAVQGYGLEIDQANIGRCFEKGVNVIQQNLDEGLGNIQDKRFDYVVMTQAIQAVQNPALILDEMLRVGQEAIVTFPNFGHWRVWLYLMIKGRMPVSSALPYEWYNTPNIHLCTVKDFDAYCKGRGFQVLERVVVDKNHRQNAVIQMMPNLFGEIAMYRLSR